MKRLTLLFSLLVTFYTFANDAVPQNEWPFYSFQLVDYYKRPHRVEEFKNNGFVNKKEGEKILCKRISKNCKLMDYKRYDPN